MRRLRRVKIVATLGPASNEEAMIEELARAGADVFRINMSHASHELLAQTVSRIRNVEARLGHAARHPRRPAGPQAPRRHDSPAARSCSTPAPSSSSTAPTTPGTTERVYLPHPEIIESV